MALLLQQIGVFSIIIILATEESIPDIIIIIIIIIITIKKGQQCKAMRERYTPYQSKYLLQLQKTNL